MSNKEDDYSLAIIIVISLALFLILIGNLIGWKRGYSDALKDISEGKGWIANPKNHNTKECDILQEEDKYLICINSLWLDFYRQTNIYDKEAFIHFRIKEKGKKK